MKAVRTNVEDGKETRRWKRKEGKVDPGIRGHQPGDMCLKAREMRGQNPSAHDGKARYIQNAVEA